MSGTLYLAWRYLAFHRAKAVLLVTSITLILYLPVGLRVLVDQGARQLTARAQATPLLVGAKGSPLELALKTLYFGSDGPEPVRYAEATRVADSGLAQAIPMYVRFHARGRPIVGTTLDYLAFRDLRVGAGRPFALLGEAVLGARAAEALGVGPGGHVVSAPENAFDLAGVYPLRMQVAGVLEASGTPDDEAIFVDVKTAWVIQGIGHGHQDLMRSGAAGAVLSREGSTVTANASLVQYAEITPRNLESFHFHGDRSAFPLTAIIAVPPDPKASALLQGRYQGADELVQIVRPAAVMDELLATVLTVQQFVVAGAVVVGLATLATATLVFLLSLRLRRREIETLFKIGGSRLSVGAVMACEIVGVLLTSVVLAGVLTALTGWLGPTAIRAWMLS